VGEAVGLGVATSVADGAAAACDGAVVTAGADVHATASPAATAPNRIPRSLVIVPSSGELGAR